MTAAYLLALLAAVLPPDDAASACTNHASQLDATASNRIRYLQSIAVDEEGRKKDWVAATYLLNMASENRIHYSPPVFGDGEFIVVDLGAISDPNDASSFAKKFETWEKLAADDPYWHIRTQVAVTDKKGDFKQVTVPGGWCAEQLGKLNEATGSQGAVLRLDYFIAKAGAELFNEFANTRNTLDEELDFYGVDENVIALRQGQVAANIARSNVRVGRAPRRIVAMQGVHGPVIFTLDNAKDNAAGNPFAFPSHANDVQRFKADAYEVFALAANGWWRTSIYNGERKIVAEVPANNIAADRFGDGVIRNGVSCVRCHSSDGGSAGVQAFKDQQAKLNQRGVKGYDPAVLATAIAAYDEGRMAKFLKRAQEDHHDAVTSVCGTKTPDEAVAILSDVFSKYRDADVTLSVAAHEVGLTEEEFAKHMPAANDAGGIISLLLLGDPVSRGQWEPTFAECILTAEKTRVERDGNAQ